MSIEQLDNLVKTRNLKREAPDQKQADGLSQQGQFLSAYGACCITLAWLSLR